MKTFRLLKYSLRASTIIEVTTALIIISMVSGLAILIYLNVQRTGISFRRLACTIMIEEVYTDTKRTGKYESKEVQYEDITILQRVEPYADADGLLAIHIEARDLQGKLIAEQKHLVYAPAEP